MREIDVEALAGAVESGACVLDVREPGEYAAGHVPGAVSVPMRQLPGRIDELDTRAPVYVICATGNRSRAMTELLTSVGLDAQNVAGGTRAWIESGRRVEGGAG